MTISIDPTDPTSPEEFPGWEIALAQGCLKPDQMATLQSMVDDGRSATLDEAASILDLQETIINPPSHMWGS